MEAFFESLPVWVNVVIFAAGAVFIYLGAGWFESGAEGIAGATGWGKVVVGAIFVSLVTTSPEFSVSWLAAYLGRAPTAVGNAIGSTICNIGLILALAALIRPVRIDPGAVRIQGAGMLGAGAVVILMAQDGKIDRVEGALLLAFTVVFLTFSAWRASRNNPRPLPGEGPQGGWPLILRRFFQGGGFVVVGSFFLVQTAARLARAWGVPELVIGLSLVALGTSLPELVFSVKSSLEGHGESAAGNVMGANLLNISLVVGGAAAIAPLPIERQTFVLDFPAMMIVMILSMTAAAARGGIGRTMGAGLFLAYVLYLVVMFSSFA